jgi:GT2 family glycosyltransferase
MCAGGNVQCDIDHRRFPLLTSYITFGCVYLKRDVIKKCGLLHPEYFAYCEDLDYCLTANTKGLASVMDGRVNVLHTQSATSIANPHIDIEAIKNHSQIILSKRWGDKIKTMPLPELLEGRQFKKMAKYPIWH